MANSLANHPFAFLIFAVLMVCILDNGAHAKVDAPKGKAESSPEVESIEIGKIEVDGKEFAVCGPSEVISGNITQSIEWMSNLLDNETDLGKTTRGILFINPTQLDPKNPMVSNVTKVSRQYQLEKRIDLCLSCKQNQTSKEETAKILQEILVATNSNDGITKAKLYSFLDKNGTIVKDENGTFNLLESFLGCLKGDKLDSVTSDIFLEGNHWIAFQMDIVGKNQSEIKWYYIKEYCCESSETSITIGTNLPSIIKPNTDHDAPSKMVMGTNQNKKSSVFTIIMQNMSFNVIMNTNQTLDQTTTDWPRSDQLTEQQKKQKLEECQLIIDKFNRKHPTEQRKLNEKKCLMNLEELKEELARLGGMSEKEYKPFEGNQTQRCEGPNCKLVVPIPKGTPLNISWDTFEQIETIVNKRAPRDVENQEKEVINFYCHYEEFDLRKKAKSEICRKKIGVVEQAQCGSCAFVATTAAITGRYCMATTIFQSETGPIDACQTSTLNKVSGYKCGEHLRHKCKKIEKYKISSRDAMECMADSCTNTAWPGPIWDFHTKKFLINDICKPYREFSEQGCCPKQPQPIQCCNNFNCDVDCEDDLIPYANQIYRPLISSYHLSGTNFMKTIMEEIEKNGPVTATFHIHNDFNGEIGKAIYTVSEGAKRVGLEAVMLIGFGEKKCYNTKGGPLLSTTKYWIAANSWGKEWNGDGTFRIKRGTNEAGIENHFDYGHFKQWECLPKLFAPKSGDKDGYTDDDEFNDD